MAFGAVCRLPAYWCAVDYPYTVLLFVGPLLIVNGTGQLENGATHVETIGRVLGFIDSPTGVAACLAGAILFAGVALGISAAVSLKVYERREL